MRTPSRIATTAVALAAVFPVGIGPARADTATEIASGSAYFSSTTPAKDDALPSDPGPQFTRLGTDQVAENNLAVAVSAPDRSDKESFVRFEMAGVMALVFEGKDVTIDSALVTVPLQPDDDKNRSLAPDPAKVKACATGPEGFADGMDAVAYDEKPTVDCNKLNVVAKASADGTAYTFDVTSIANAWLTDLNDGIGLVPAQMSSPFQVVFKAGSTVTLDLTYTVIEDEDVVDPIPTTNPLPPVDTYVPPTNTGTVTPPIVNVPQPTPAPTAAPRPTAAPTQPITNVAGRGFLEDNSLSAGFWLAAIAGVGLIGAMSLFLGNPEVAVAGSSRNGVGRALDERRRVGRHSGARTSARPFRTA